MTFPVGKDGLPVILFETQDLWENWFENNLSARGVWVQLAKKNSGIQSISYEQAVESGLCYGWIDGVKNGWDDKTWIQRFSPRKPASKWSKINKEKALKLIEAGKMQPSGFAAIEISKLKGTWDNAYDSQKTAKIPADLQAELDKNPLAAEYFQSLESVNRYAILHRLQTSRTPELRSKKLNQFMEMLVRKEKIHNLNS